MHKLLERQLLKRYGTIDKVPKELLVFCADTVEPVYQDHDEDRRLSEHSLEISSKELLEKNKVLREQSARLRQVLDGMVEGMQIIDRNWRYVYVNEAVARQGKTTRERLLGRTMMECYPGIDTAPFFESLKKAMNERRLISMKNEFFFPDGSSGWFLLNIQPVEEGILIMSSDVTEEVKATARLREEQERLRQIVENIAEVFFMMKADFSEMLYVSPAFEEIWGITPDTLYKNPLAWADYLVPQDRERVLGEMKLSGSSTFPIVQKPFRIQRPDGSIRWIDGHLTPVSDSEGKVYRVAGVARDVTAIMKANERIKELDILKNKFINIVSHQFRTPLSAIRWSLEAMLGGEVGKLTDAQQEFVRIAHDADNEIIRRIGDLLTAMDIEEGRALVTREEMSFESLWTSVLPFWKKQCGLKQLVCEYEAPSQPLPVIGGDADKIRSIMEKLADNALIYTPEKGKISVQISIQNSMVRFMIKDTGIGIPLAEQKRVFTRFFRATNAATMKADASGLGLYIAKHFVEQHGGKIGFSSNVDAGSTFWFELPM